MLNILRNRWLQAALVCGWVGGNAIATTGAFTVEAAERGSQSVINKHDDLKLITNHIPMLRNLITDAGREYETTGKTSSEYTSLGHRLYLAGLLTTAPVWIAIFSLRRRDMKLRNKNCEHSNVPA